MDLSVSQYFNSRLDGLATSLRLQCDVARAEWNYYTNIGEAQPLSLARWVDAMEHLPGTDEVRDMDMATVLESISNLQGEIDIRDELVENLRADNGSLRRCLDTEA